MPQPFNAIDVTYGHTPQAEVQFSKLPYILAKKELKSWKSTPLVRKLLGKAKWQPNEGATVMRTEYSTPSPVQRQMPKPNKMFQSEPNFDVIGTRRFYNEATPGWKGFHSAEFYWQNSFVEKFPDSIKDAFDDIMNKQKIYDETYLLSELYFQAPRVYIAGQGFISVKPSSAMDQTVKTPDWVQAQVVGKAREAQITDFMQIASQMHDNEGIPFFQGKDYDESSPVPGGTFALLCSTEFMLNLTFDQHLTQNRMLNTDLVGDVWKKTPFGMYTWKTWRTPFRFQIDGTTVAPEITESAADAFNLNETVPNPLYTSMLNDGSPYEVAIILGPGAGEALEVGPPPSEFTNSSVSSKITAIDWNGKIKMNDLFLVPTVGDDGVATVAINPMGLRRRYESLLSVGYVPRQRRAVTLYFYKRKLGPAAV